MSGCQGKIVAGAVFLSRIHPIWPEPVPIERFEGMVDDKAKRCAMKAFPELDCRQVWNKGRIVGKKRSFKPKHMWSIRIRLAHLALNSSFSNGAFGSSSFSFFPLGLCHSSGTRFSSQSY